MAQLFNGRYTAQIEGDFVVFLIGMRINQLWAVHKWGPVSAAMPRMLRELMRNRALGLLHVQSCVMGRSVIGIQYWRNFEQLHAYAHMRDAAHLPAWTAFNRRSRDNSAVGIFHETYLVRAGEYECVYKDMPRMGLARAAEMVPATGRLRSAKTRLGQEDTEKPLEYEQKV